MDRNSAIKPTAQLHAWYTSLGYCWKGGRLMWAAHNGALASIRLRICPRHEVDVSADLRLTRAMTRMLLSGIHYCIQNPAEKPLYALSGFFLLVMLTPAAMDSTLFPQSIGLLLELPS